MREIRQLKETMGKWLWLCPLLALGLAFGVLVIWGLTLWSAIVAALLLVCPALIIWGVVVVSRDGANAD